MKKVLSAIVMTLLTVSLTATSDAGEKTYKIGVYFWHESPLDEMAFDGVRAGFKKSGVAHEFDIQRAYGDKNKAGQIVQKFAEDKPDLIYAMGTGATKQLMEKIEDTPMIFTALFKSVTWKGA